MERSTRQRSIIDFCQRQHRSQPSTAQHGHCTAEEGGAGMGQSDLTIAWQPQGVEVIEPSSSSGHSSQVHSTAAQTQPDSPRSVASSHVAMCNPNVGLQLCTSSCPITASLWTTIEAPERKALQAVSYFVNSDLRWYIKDLPAIHASQSTAKLAESERPTDDEIASLDSEPSEQYLESSASRAGREFPAWENV